MEVLRTFHGMTMPGSIEFTDKGAVQVLASVLDHSHFETVVVSLTRGGLSLRAMDGSRTMIMSADIPKSAATNITTNEPVEVAVNTQQLESVLTPFVGQFDQYGASLRFRFSTSGLETHVRVADQVSRSRLLRDAPDAHFKIPRMREVDSAPSASIVDSDRFTLASGSFPESAELELSLGEGQVKVQTSSEDLLAFKADTSGLSASKVHQHIFRIASKLGQLSTLKVTRIAVVSDGICNFRFDFGTLGTVNYFVAPLADTESS